MRDRRAHLRAVEAGVLRSASAMTSPPPAGRGSPSGARSAGAARRPSTADAVVTSTGPAGSATGSPQASSRRRPSPVPSARSRRSGGAHADDSAPQRRAVRVVARRSAAQPSALHVRAAGGAIRRAISRSASRPSRSRRACGTPGRSGGRTAPGRRALEHVGERGAPEVGARQRALEPHGRAQQLPRGHAGDAQLGDPPAERSTPGGRSTSAILTRSRRTPRSPGAACPARLAGAPGDLDRRGAPARVGVGPSSSEGTSRGAPRSTSIQWRWTRRCGRAPPSS